MNVKYRKLSESIYGTGYVWMLEKQFEYYHNHKHHCISVSNATLGIWASLSVLGLNEGDKVIVAPFSFGGTIAGVIQINPTIIFGDFDRISLSLSPESVRELLQKYSGVKAVIDVDFLGLPSRSKEISEICREHNVMYILDCANSFGTLNSGYPSGYFADISIYSLNSQKNLKGGEGGLICTRHKDIYKEIVMTYLHPDRQRKEYPVNNGLNQFSLNLRIHPLAAYMACKNFNKVLKKIDQKQRKILKNFPFLKAYYGDSIPNFNYILVNKKKVEIIQSSRDIEYLQFDLTGYYLPGDPKLLTTDVNIISHVEQRALQNLQILHIV
ncbi:MAG: DegT/DnrJ/EryC1/StrS family aminotransferase [Bacteroidales bacterium]|nr:DegT/DnrJ/EryC1/StrS family aminotransferase [Bacteroidales bacterium]